MKNKSAAYRISLPFQLLKTFTEKELINFEKLLVSGYLGSKDGLDLLLKSLKKYALHGANFTQEVQLTIYGVLYSKESIDNGLNDNQRKKLSRAMNDLLNIAEKFLMFERIKNTVEHDSTLLFPELIDRNQLLLYSRRIKATEKKLSGEKKKGIEYHNQCYSIQHEKARLLFINNVLTKEDNYDELQYHADIKYLLQKLQYHLAKITLQRRYAHKTFNYKPFEALQTLVNLPEYSSNPLVQLYLLNIELVEGEAEATFLALSKMLNEKQDIIPPGFLKPFYTNLNNFCIYSVTKGNLNYHKHLFNIYNDMHKANIFISNNVIDNGLLKNIITNACRINAFDWAIDKLAHYISYVPKSIRNSVFEYNSGIIAFNQQKYEEALNCFNQVRKIDNTHELSLRIVQLQCYYETDRVYEESTQQIIESLKIYIHQNKKLTMRQKKAYFNFVRIFNKLYQFKDIPDKRGQQIAISKTLPKLKERLSKFSLVRKKQWLLNKINVLDNSLAINQLNTVG